MRLLRNALSLCTCALLVLSGAAFVYSLTTDVSQTDSNANLGEFWAVTLLCLGGVCLIATLVATVAARDV